MLNKQIVATVFDDGDGVLVDLETKRYYQLNETAMIVWDALENGSTAAQIVDEFTTKFDVQQDHAIGSVERILNKFKSLNLTD
jgi:hypothetical protein